MQTNPLLRMQHVTKTTETKAGIVIWGNFITRSAGIRMEHYFGKYIIEERKKKNIFGVQEYIRCYCIEVNNTAFFRSLKIAGYGT